MILTVQTNLVKHKNHKGGFFSRNEKTRNLEHGVRNWSTWSTSGMIFIVAGLRSEDYLATSGSVVWAIACLLWFIPVLSRRNSQRLENPQPVVPAIPFLPDRILWNRPLLPATERLRLVGVFKANRKTLAKIEGIFLLYLLLGWMSTNGFNRGKGR